ncbi:unnamed protein product [Rotaria sp. Silwood2]|nr:unnamed protein product [Rotaria sp. Silwood2]CAF2757265.1 unnamed protein product [Rotaria sp. Silwood2]CAF2809151.1 unnamed protein product [Rotaria sp. Silwood2]CAF2970596.1 unnamed protein product [Rotaria sp. Silwood2]CAF3860149.1 unnamed protein product [Rotaria sp. Silwood2]
MNSIQHLMIEMIGKFCSILISMSKKPTECTYSEIIKKLRTNYARVTFFATRQESSQTVTDFSNSLRDKSVTYKFPNDFCEDALIVAFVGGLRNEHVRKHLMQQSLETFEQTLNTARIFESVLIQAANVKDNLSEDSYIMEIQQNDKHYECSSQTFLFKFVTKKVIVKVCRSQTTSNNVKINTVCPVKYQPNIDEDPIQIPIQIDGLYVTFELDTGSPITIINEHIRKKMGKPKLTPVKSIYSSFTGHSIHLKGEKMVKMIYNGQSSRLKILVGGRNRNNIVGHNWINSLHLNRIKLNDMFSNNTISNVNSEIKYIRTTPEHPQSIDQTERNVYFEKSVLTKGLHNRQNISNVLSKCLCCSRTTPHPAISTNPTELFLKRQRQTVLDLSRSDATDASSNKVFVHDFRNHSNKVEWVPGVLIGREGPRIWTVKVGIPIWHRYDDQIKHRQWSSDDDVIVIGPLKTTTGHDKDSSTSPSTSDQGPGTI